FQLLENFIKKYKNTGYTYDEFRNLSDLLSTRGQEFNDQLLRDILQRETNLQNFKEFSDRILHTNPMTLEQYITNLIQAYDDQFPKYLEFFKELLGYKEIIYNQMSLIDEIKRIKRSIELSRFELKLSPEQLEAFSTAKLDAMGGYEFESFLKNLFERMGYHVE